MGSFPVLVYRLGVVLCVWLIRARTFKWNRVKLCDSTSAIQVFYRVKAPFSSCCLDESLNMTCFVCQVVSKFYLIHSLTPWNGRFSNNYFKGRSLRRQQPDRRLWSLKLSRILLEWASLHSIFFSGCSVKKMSGISVLLFWMQLWRSSATVENVMLCWKRCVQYVLWKKVRAE